MAQSEDPWQYPELDCLPATLEAASVASPSSVASLETWLGAGEFGLRNRVHQRARSGLGGGRSLSVTVNLIGHDAGNGGYSQGDTYEHDSGRPYSEEGGAAKEAVF